MHELKFKCIIKFQFSQFFPSLYPFNNFSSPSIPLSKPPFPPTGRKLCLLEVCWVYCVHNKEYLNLYLILIVMNEIGANFYRGSQSNTTKSKNNKASYDDLKFQHLSREKQLLKDEQQTNQQLKRQNQKLKKLLKQTQAKRTQVTKHCSQLTRKCDSLEEQNVCLLKKLKDGKDFNEGQRFRYEEIKFLNKELTSQIEEIRLENEQLSEKLQYQTDIIERKYEDLEEKTYKRMQQSLKRLKKAIHYLSSLTPKEIEKTKEIQIQNLKRTVQILKGKYNEDHYEEEIEELMSPIRNIQEELHQKTKQANMFRQQNNKLLEELYKHKKVESQLLPQYKEAIQKLKKNLGQVRTQLSENEYEKCQLKKKYQEKIKQIDYRYKQLERENRKLKLQNRINENKLEQMEADVQEEKQRLMGENQILKKLYRSDGEDNRSSSRDNLTQGGGSYKTTKNFRKGQYTDMELEFHEKEDDRVMKKNYSASQLRNSSAGKSSLNQSNARLRLGQSKGKYEHLRYKNRNLETKKKLQISDSYQEQNGSFEEENLKHDIVKIEQDIVNLRKQLTHELDQHFK